MKFPLSRTTPLRVFLPIRYFHAHLVNIPSSIKTRTHMWQRKEDQRFILLPVSTAQSHSGLDVPMSWSLKSESISPDSLLSGLSVYRSVRRGGWGGLGDLAGRAFLSAALNDCGFVCSFRCAVIKRHQPEKSRKGRWTSHSRVAKRSQRACHDLRSPILTLLSDKGGPVLDWLASAVELGIQLSCSFYLCVHTSQGRVLSSCAGFVWSWYLLRQLVFALRIVGSSFK